MVQVLFLGTGGAFSAGERGNLAFLIEAPGFTMLVEAGPLIVQQLACAGYSPDQIEHLFISHAHGDHSLGFPMLALCRHVAAKPLHVYASGTTCDALETLCLVSYPGLGLNRCNLLWHRLPAEGEGTIELIPGVWLRTALVPHPPAMPTLAARWDFTGGISITFATDTIPNSVVENLARGSTLLIHEATYSATLGPAATVNGEYHTTAQQAGELARRAQCLRLALVHLGPAAGQRPEVLIAEARAGTQMEVIVPQDGTRIALSDTR